MTSTSTSTDTAHRELCHALFDAIERGDLAGVEACYAPGMTMWFNVTGEDTTREGNLTALAGGASLHRRRTYDDASSAHSTTASSCSTRSTSWPTTGPGGRCGRAWWQRSTTA